jgi:pimeloyl-ACP methyl ester carboxylesterase
VTGEWTEAAGERIFARRLEGPAGASDVVLVHGLVVSGRYMLPLAVHLAAQRTAHVPDLPGIGRSRSAPMDAGIAALADALVGWLHARRVVRPHLVANSVGCQIAAAAATRRPGAAALAGAELVLIAGAHALNFSHPAALAAALRRFFATAEGA